MSFTIVRNDITKMNADVIVNAANTELQMGGGVCGAIFRAAGAEKLQDACAKLAPIKTGDAVITKGFELAAKYVIHTAGPVYRGGTEGEEALLYSCYKNSLELAVKNSCESIAFPLISSGIYGYPKADAFRVAATAIREFISANDIDVYLIVFDRDAFAISEKLLGNIESYIDEHYVDEHFDRHRLENLNQAKNAALFAFGALPVAVAGAMPSPKELKDFIGNLDEPFSDTLLRLIDSKGKTDVEVYKRANLDRRLFSKIRGGKGYMPSKRTVLALAVALELTLKETDDLLRRAGFALSPCHKGDLLVKYFIVNGQYDIYEINEILFCHDQQLLGGCG